MGRWQYNHIASFQMNPLSTRRQGGDVLHRRDSSNNVPASVAHHTGVLPASPCGNEMSGVVGGEDDELDDGDASPDLDDDQRPRRPLRRCHPMMRSRPPCWRSPPVLLSGEKYTYNQLQNYIGKQCYSFYCAMSDPLGEETGFVPFSNSISRLVPILFHQ